MFLTFNNTVKFYEYIKSLDNDVDIRKSCNGCPTRAPTYLGFTEKEDVRLCSTQGLLVYLNDNYDTNISLVKSVFTFTTIYISFEDKESSNEIIKMEDVVAEVAVTPSKIDLTKVEVFKTLATKKAKEALADYALESFEVTLKKNMTFEDMLTKLKETL